MYDYSDNGDMDIIRMYQFVYIASVVWLFVCVQIFIRKRRDDLISRIGRKPEFMHMG